MRDKLTQNDIHIINPDETEYSNSLDIPDVAEVTGFVIGGHSKIAKGPHDLDACVAFIDVAEDKRFYYIMTDDHQDLIDPWDVRARKDEWVRVTRHVFGYYLQFLRTHNPSYLDHANVIHRREI
jgi:hypothetical protein